MAHPALAWSDNVGGQSIVAGRRVAFYVDETCILCTVCATEAPKHFALSTDEDHDVVVAQPTTVEGLRACDAAMAGCPVEAIGDDGPYSGSPSAQTS